jgi:hypothetical protein
VKRRIDGLLDKFAPDLWYHKPVQNGMGKPCLDYHCCFHGLYFVVEAKAPGEDPTKRQEITIEEINRAGGQVFVVSNDEGMAALESWLIDTHQNELYR